VVAADGRQSNNVPPQKGPRTLSVFNAVFFGGSGTVSTSEMMAYVEGKGIYRTTDNGANWSPYGSGLPNPLLALAGIVRQNGTTFYVGKAKGPIDIATP